MEKELLDEHEEYIDEITRIRLRAYAGFLYTVIEDVDGIDVDDVSFEVASAGRQLKIYPVVTIDLQQSKPNKTLQSLKDALRGEFETQQLDVDGEEYESDYSLGVYQRNASMEQNELYVMVTPFTIDKGDGRGLITGSQS